MFNARSIILSVQLKWTMFHISFWISFCIVFLLWMSFSPKHNIYDFLIVQFVVEFKIKVEKMNLLHYWRQYFFETSFTYIKVLRLILLIDYASQSKKIFSAMNAIAFASTHYLCEKKHQVMKNRHHGSA